MDVDVAFDRLANGRFRTDYILGNDLEYDEEPSLNTIHYLQRQKEIYNTIFSKRNVNVKYIDSSQSIEDQHNEILAQICKFYNLQ